MKSIECKLFGTHDWFILEYKAIEGRLFVRRVCLKCERYENEIAAKMREKLARDKTREHLMIKFQEKIDSGEIADSLERK